MIWESPFIAVLVTTVVRPLLLVASAMLGIRIFRIQHPASQHAVWTGVLIGLLVIPMLSLLTPHVDLAILPASSSPDFIQRAIDAPRMKGGGNSADVEINPLLLYEQGVVAASPAVAPGVG